MECECAQGTCTTMHPPHDHKAAWGQQDAILQHQQNYILHHAPCSARDHGLSSQCSHASMIWLFEGAAAGPQDIMQSPAD